MKNTFEPEASRQTNSTRQRTWWTGLLLLALSIWAACGCLAFQRTHQAHSARECCDWYHRGRVEIRQFVSLVNYLLTPEEDTGGTAFWTGSGQPALPVTGRLRPAHVADPGDSPPETVATNCSAPPKS